MESSDSEFWGALREQRPAAYDQLEALVRQHCESTFRRLGASAQAVPDLLQDVLVSVWEFAQQHPEPPQSLSGFLYWRARGAWVGALRRRGGPRTDLEVATTLSGEDGDPIDELVTQELVQALRECRDELRPAQAEVWEARYEGGLDTQQAAAMLQQTREQVALLLHRARRALEACLKRKRVLG